MQQYLDHTWELDAEQAKKLQQELASRVITKDDHGPIQTVAGVDVAYAQNGDQCAGVVILDLMGEVLDWAIAEDRQSFDYASGLFSFRELPSIIKAVEKLKIQPDLFICDGNGLAHPRFFGLASHLGLWFDTPSIGCAKKPFTRGTSQPGPNRGDTVDLIFQDRLVGRALRTKTDVKPVYVSIGHRISLETAIRWVLHYATYRLPDTTRFADQLGRRFFEKGTTEDFDPNFSKR